MSVRPGQNLVRFAAGLAAVGIIAFFWSPILWLLAAALLAIAIAAEFERRELRTALKSITIARALPPVIGRDEPFDISLTLRNTSASPFRGELRDEHPTDVKPAWSLHPVELSANGSLKLKTPVRIPRRGRFTFGPAWLRAFGPWQLVEVHQSFDCPGAVSVLPETFASRERLQKDLRAELKLLDENQRSRQFGSGTEFESLYQFRDGDDPRRIDWRATARQQTLVVRRFQVERHRDVMIVVDSGRLMGADVGKGSKLDCAVDAALNLARVALRSGDRCGIAAYDHQVRGFLPPIAGKTALRSLTECVFDLQTKWEESDFTPMLAELRARQSKRTFLVVISDLADAETSKRLCASLLQLKRQHLVLFAALKTPYLGKVIAETVHIPQDVAKKAVVFRLLRDRRHALHTLSHGGIHTLDIEPQQLTTPLINQFIDLRQRNLL